MLSIRKCGKSKFNDLKTYHVYIKDGAFHNSFKKKHSNTLKVLSNMPCQKESEEIIKFKRTPNMPTYLICLVIRYYDSISR